MTYTPVEPSRRRRWRRRLRRVPWRGLQWLGGTAGAAGWWATQPEVSWVDAVMAGCVFGLLLGAALAPPRRRGEKRGR